MNEQEVRDLVAYWADSAEYDWDTAQAMLDAKRFPYALFMCHLALEKILKALIVDKTKAHAEYSHNLVTLARTLTDVPLDEVRYALLAEINGFNMKARYPEWERAFYKKADAEFTTKYMQATHTLYIWLTQYLPK